LEIPAREYLRRGWKFFLVGVLGFGVNQGSLMLLVGLGGLPPWLAGLIAIELSIVCVWMMNDSWTWRDRRGGRRLKRALKYNASAGITAFGVNYPILVALTSAFGLNYAIANIIGVGCASLANFMINHHWTYAEAEV